MVLQELDARQKSASRSASALHIISRKKLLEAGKKHAVDLDAWYRVAKAAKWMSLQDVRRVYPGADGVVVGDRVYTVFNIAGNRYRLVTEIFYNDRTILIRHLLSHAEYDKENWKK
jgi:mRNA interferase HigB